MLRQIKNKITQSTLVTMVEILLFILVAYFLARIILVLFFSPEETKPGFDYKPGPSIHTSTSYNFIPVELFGKEVKKPVARTQKKVVSANLNLKLNGIIKNQDKSVALIAKSGSKTKVYAIGDKIIPGVTVKAVHNDYVILLHNGQDKILKIEKKTGAGDIFNIRERKNPTMQTKISNYKRQLTKNPQVLSGLFTGKPFMQDGKYQGLQISPGKDKELFDYLGLQDGDVIMTVDNIPLNDFVGLHKLAGKIETKSKIEILLLRDGIEQRVTLNLGGQH